MSITPEQEVSVTPARSFLKLERSTLNVTESGP
jgi:hypothetical protein